MEDLGLRGVSRKITRGDMLICAIAALLSIAVIFTFLLPEKDGNKIIIELDGEKYASFDVNGPKKVIEIRSKYGYNRVSVGDGFAQVLDADCPDKLDVRRGRIDRAGESIICLPNRLNIYIKGADAPDTVSY